MQACLGVHLADEASVRACETLVQQNVALPTGVCSLGTSAEAANCCNQVALMTAKRLRRPLTR